VRMECHVLTIFPGIFEVAFRWGILARAIERGCLRLVVHDVRSFALDPHQSTDDYPYGGGVGMVMKPEPLFAAVEAARAKGAPGPVILLSPQGEVFNQSLALELAKGPGMILICGRYEGVDERVRIGVVDREISIGDYILTGGEFAAMVIMDAAARLVEGVLGNSASSMSESFEGGVLEYPQYTRPQSFKGMCVPEVLLSGHHAEIERWRRIQALRRTVHRRPELLNRARLTEEDLRTIQEIRSGSSQPEID
jgi:tRNA (guanine37-N1)-methyltransferase